METDCYKLLGVSPSADEKTIRKAWRKKTKAVHPDVNSSPDANKQFRELTEAMEILLDNVSRIKHDHKFGYTGVVRNKFTNAKQKFSQQQEEKAKTTVNEWSQDYNAAMAMREEQRKKHLKRHKRNQLLIIIGVLAMLAVSVLLWIFYT